MNKIIYSLISLILTTSLFAQRPVCHTKEMTDYMIQQDPALAESMKKAEAEEQAYIDEQATFRTEDLDILTIPVVVHVVYFSAVQNISDEQIKSQIDALNLDYRRLNTDADETPAAFAGVAADPHIQFCLADKDPNGGITTGIIRKSTTETMFTVSSNGVKKAATGGDDAWPRDKYLNIWVCNLESTVLGYATLPGAASPAVDGVVIGYKYFGTTGVLASEFNLGRTATHEIGHWLGLFHTWGDDGTMCSGSDFILDTPNQSSENYFCPTFPHTDACSPSSPGVMFMNYMDYTDDACMNLFTTGQMNKMRSVLNTTRSTIPTSDGCWINTAVADKNSSAQISIYPNPSNGKFSVAAKNFTGDYLDFEIYNTLGEQIQKQTVGNYATQHVTFDLSAYTSGYYFLKVSNGINFISKQINIIK